ncbi:MAG: FkbM family methyltransferase [Bacteroidota bacterium]
MKNLIQRFLAIFGIRIIRAKYARKYLPKPTIENIKLLAHLYHLSGQKLTLMQVGACDGFTSDSIYEYVKAGSINAFLIEPVKVNFDKLSQFYEGYDNAKLINVAVAKQDEARPMYSVKNEGKWKGEGKARQVASFYKEHLYKCGFDDSEILEEEVDCKMLSTLINEYNIQNLEVLLIDTEGFDGQVVEMAMEQGIQPNYLVFENAQLVQNYSQRQLDDLYLLLSQNGYEWTHDRINTLAIKKDFLVKNLVG